MAKPRALMTQRWRDLLFAHWRVDPGLIQERLPAGLRVDTFRGDAYLGVVPFRMAEVRLGPLPAVPGCSDFLELNLRTYVVDEAGVPGVWFFTLDADHAVGVAIARICFHLPYHRAHQQAGRQGDGGITFRSRRRSGPDRGESVIQWRPGPPLPAPAAGERAHFLVERYVLYTAAGRGLFRGRIAHAPYRLRAAEVVMDAAPLFRAQGFVPPATPPDHIICSDGTDVAVLGLERIARIPPAAVAPRRAPPGPNPSLRPSGLTPGLPARGPVLLYDGECGLCTTLVRRLRARPRGNRIGYLPLQAAAAQAYLSARGLPTRDFDSLVFVPDWGGPDGARHLLRTDGLLAALDVIGGPFRALAWLRLIPRPIRDAAYALVARVRHRWPRGRTSGRSGGD